MQATNVPADMAAKGYVGNRINQIKDFKLWFWAAYGVQDIKMWAITGASDDTLLENLNFKADFQVMDNNRFTFFYMRGDKNKFGRGAGIRRPQETTWDQTGPSPVYKFSDEHAFSENLLVTAQYAFVDGGFQLAPKGGAAQPVYDRDTRIWGNSYFRYKTVRPQDQVNLDANVYIEDLLGAGHELKFGVEYRKTPTYSSWRPDSMVVGEYSGGASYSARFYRGGVDDYYSKRYSAYIGDTITAGRLTVNLGLRYDWRKAYINANDVGANPLIPAQLPGIAFEGLEAPFAWSDFSPRTGFTYDLTNDGKTLLRGTFNMYAGIMGNWMALDLNPLGTARIDYFWTDDGDGLVAVGELTDYPLTPRYWSGVDPLNPTLTVSNNSMASDLSAPKTWEAVVGFERELLPDFSVTVQGVYRKYTNFRWDNYQTGEVPVWTATDSVVDPWTGDTFPIYTADISNPVGRHTENRTDNYFRDYKGGDIILTKRLSNKWMMNASFTVNFTQQKWDDSLYPFDPTNSWAFNGEYYSQSTGGSGKTDIWVGSRWQFKMTGMYQLPHGFNVSGFLDAREGFIIPYFTDGIDRGSGWGWQDPDVSRFGEFRLPTFWKLDLRIEKVFSMGSWGNLSFIADIFNVFNQNMSLGIERKTSSSLFQDSQEILGPRVFRAGLRIRF
jgi:hypothetical protein